MNEMIDRVAKAIGVPEADGLVCPWSLEAARRAIEAMREPTENMLAAGSHEAFMEHANGVWRDMIDAALTK